MRFVLIADTFPPLRTSGAVQLRDLSREFVRRGHELTVLLPSASIKQPWVEEDFEGVQVVRLKAPRTKDINYVQRTLNEFMMPYSMLRNLRKSPVYATRWDGVIWYSPSIFHGPLVKALKRQSRCKAYLIIRDIFPEWAVDMGLMSRGLPYHFFNAVAQYQYSIADVIGVQTRGNLTYFDEWSKKPGRKLEVLQNWLGPAASKRCSIRIDQTTLAGRKIFVYAGNMGVAQGMDIIIDLAEKLQDRTDIGFLFVGRGSAVELLKSRSAHLSNVLFHDEIDPDEIPDLYAQCHVGIVALDSRHKSHNIPGKFLTYMQSGLPVIANVNRGNDLAGIIRSHSVGVVCESNSIQELVSLAIELDKNVSNSQTIHSNCERVFADSFAAKLAVEKITQAIK
ncbi:glycosyltransferase family 4 protein [Orrella marina]|uniref:Glycosyltransferase WbuB n=1 Tax=Orrella marina TaxID=2163011 RepID=A0A2R4XGU6_9BURK|nr:glycosyltransferase family 4 protein [Orrella marina]AWB33025.1 glycosyltransferase WbuB [Orrella marina]